MRSLELRACDGLTPARVTASHQSFLALGDRYCGERECPLLGEQRPRVSMWGHRFVLHRPRCLLDWRSI